MEKSHPTREDTMRSSQERDKPYRPPQMLDAPNPPDGYEFTWIRRRTKGEDDDMNMAAAFRDGHEIVLQKDFGEWPSDIIEHGRYQGAICSGDLILMKIPVEMAKKKRKFYADMTLRQMDAVNQEIDKHKNPFMRPFVEEQRSTVTRGRETAFSDDE